MVSDTKSLLTGGFQPGNLLHSHPRPPKQTDGQQTKSHLASFIEKPRARGLVQDLKRQSDDSGLDGELPPRKKQAPRGRRAGSPDLLGDLPTEATELPDPTAKRTRSHTQSYLLNQRHDHFQKSKQKTRTDPIEDSDSSHTDNDPIAGRTPIPNKSADMQKTTFVTAGTGVRLKVLRAACLNSTYNCKDEVDERQIYLGFKDNNFKPVNHQGSAVANYEWLELKPGTMQKVYYGRDFSPVSIHRSGGVNLPPLLHLEFASSDAHKCFIDWVKERAVKLKGTVKINPVEKESESLKRAFEKSFAKSHERVGTAEDPAAISPKQPMRNSPAVSSTEKAKPEPRQKLTQTMRAGLPTSQSTFAVIPLEEEPSASIVTRSSRRRTLAVSGKSVESPNPIIISLDDEGLSPTVSKKASRRPAATPTPPPARWVDLNPEWVKAWDDKPLIYPSSGRDAAQITKEDIPRLEDKELLNDSLIIFSSRYILEQQAKEMSSLLSRTYIFNPWFYKKLSLSSKRGIDYEAVKSWTSKVDLFAYDFVVVPVNENFHWYLAIICYPGKLLPQKDDDIVMMVDDPQDVPSEPQQPTEATSSGPTEREDDDNIVMVVSDVTPKPPSRPAQATASKDQKPAKATVNPKDPRVITFDSLGGAHSPTCTSLREYLVLEAKHRHGVDIKIPIRFGLTAKGIPEQNDFNSCGAYLLGYLQKFFQNPDGSVERIVLKQGPNWEIDPKEVRAEMRKAIMDARDKQNDQVKREQEARDDKRRKRNAARLANGASPAPSSPTSELPPSGTMNSTEVRQCAKEIESDRLSRGDVTSLNPSQRMVQDQDPKRELAGRGPGASKVTAEEPAGASPDITAAAFSGTRPQVIPDTSPETSPTTCARAIEGGPTESSPGPSAEAFTGPTTRDVLSVSSEAQEVIPEPIREVGLGPLKAVVSLSSTPSRVPSSSQVANVMEEPSLSPRLETYANLLAGRPLDSPRAVEAISLDSDPPSQASMMDLGDDFRFVDDDAGHASDYYTASETSPGQPSNALGESGQQQSQRRVSTANNPFELVSASHPAAPRPPVTSSYFALKDSPNLLGRAVSPPSTKQALTVETSKNEADCKAKNPFVHKKTTSAARSCDIDLTKEEEEMVLRERNALVDMTVDLTQEDD